MESNYNASSLMLPNLFSNVSYHPKFADKDIQMWEGKTLSELSWRVFCGDALEVLKALPKESFNCVVTSPPYFWLRDYKVEGQIGWEDSVEEYVNALVQIMDEIYRVLLPDGTLFLNIGDTYYSGKGESQGVDKKSPKRRFGLRAVDKGGGLGLKLRPKTAIGIPWRVAIEMSQQKWILRSSIIWNRQFSLPESVKDRPRRTYENIFMFTKGRKYFFNREPLERDGEEDIWNIPARTEPNGLDTAPFPDLLVQRCLEIGCPENGSVLDPFVGSGTTMRVALNAGHSAVGIDLNQTFCQYIVKRLAEERL
ncbi:MAG: site-specific DNA-methyltransferase [Anaerolineae bacterium]|nr:site-specific DNA-methyltransferase [Anaerolineae bacterium]